MRVRKKPIVIEAVLIAANAGSTGGFAEMPAWLEAALQDGKVRNASDEEGGVIVRTLSGKVRAQPGDWLVSGVAGELYVCKQELFDTVYEALPD
jgi:hypothetical protein